MLTLRAWVLLLFVALLAAPAQVDAQVPPDVIRLRDGGMLRGTITEHVPDSHVSILLPSGESRRVPASDVLWAGPAAEMPPPGMSVVTTPPSYGSDAAPATSPVAPGVYAPPGTALTPAVPVATATVPVHFEADREGVRVDLRVGTHEQLFLTTSRYGISSHVVQRPIFQQLCIAPCTHEMAAGRFQIGVGLGHSGRTYLIPRVIEAQGPTRVQIHWDDRYAFRVIGSLVWAIGGALGTTGMILGTIVCLNTYCGNAPSTEFLIAGAITLGVASAVGIPMTFLRDEISFDLGPL